MQNNNILWYENPAILLKNLNQFYPDKKLEYSERINSIARLSIYLIIIINIFSLHKIWYIIPLGLLIYSYFIINVNDDQEELFEYSKPTLNNPFMNYTLGQTPPIKTACPYEDCKTDIRKKFRSTLNIDSRDIWGRNITDRNFYTMPSNINNQVHFAKWCYNAINSGECKTFGSNCIKYRNPKYHVGRYSY